jgi:uncharacterized protein (TIGR00369 family)
MDPAQAIAVLNKQKPVFLNFLGGKIVALDPESRSCTFEFCVPLDYCHSGNIVQGGFVTAMLDAAMAHAIFGIDSSITRLSSLEISTRYESATFGEQTLTVTGRIRKVTRSIVFLDGEIRDEQGNLTATAQSTAKIARSD